MGSEVPALPHGEPFGKAPTTDTARQSGCGSPGRFQDPHPRCSPCRPGTELVVVGLSAPAGGLAITSPQWVRLWSWDVSSRGARVSGPRLHGDPGQGPGGWGQGLRVWRRAGQAARVRADGSRRRDRSSPHRAQDAWRASSPGARCVSDVEPQGVPARVSAGCPPLWGLCLPLGSLQRRGRSSGPGRGSSLPRQRSRVGMGSRKAEKVGSSGAGGAGKPRGRERSNVEH